MLTERTHHNSKNMLNDGTHGLLLIMAFPIYSEAIEDMDDKKNPVILIKEGVENLACIIRTFQKVMVSPYIVQKADEIDSKKIPLENITVYASMDGVDKFRKKFGNTGHLHTLVRGSPDVVFFADHFAGFGSSNPGNCTISCDCVHLNCSGHTTMADIWWQARPQVPVIP